ncbi:unnamed protein product [Brassica oleracea]|uniref:(rape) hypothetical protein n=1 Tax=Brassica napus TaxID=3708 RepID=A0A816JGY9_BRANA|nr:unnamed protein product [Brassica napus]
MATIDVFEQEKESSAGEKTVGRHRKHEVCRRSWNFQDGSLFVDTCSCCNIVFTRTLSIMCVLP